MIKLFGILDLLAAMFLLLAQWGIGLKIAMILAVYLIIKGVLFITDWASWVDIGTGLYMFLIIKDIHSAFSLIFMVWLLQKAFFSLAI